MTDIIRPMTMQEKADMVEAGSLDYERRFLALMAEKAMEYQKKYIPFCQRCALLDYKDKVNALKNEIKRTEGSVSDNDRRLSGIKVDWDYYTTQFESVDDAEIIENRVINGERQPVIIGYWQNFKCKTRKCNLAMEVPKSKYEEMKKKSTK